MINIDFRIIIVKVKIQIYARQITQHSDRKEPERD